MNVHAPPTRRTHKAATGGRALYTNRDHRSRLYGMTLVELLVVLTILAVLSAVAVVSTETVVRQGRFEATQRTLRAVEEAVLGPELFRAEDGSLATSGFVADIGRLPVDLAELWSPGGLPAFQFVPAAAENLDPADTAYADDEVVVPCGWRGPYLRLPVGAADALDGWGRPFEADVDTSTSEIVAVRSLGADGLAGSSPDDPYSGELEVAFVAGDADRYRTTVQVSVWQRGEDGGLEMPSGTGTLTVRLFGVAEGGVGVFPPDEPESGYPLSAEPESAPPSFYFDNVPIGPHVLRAYVEGTDRKSAPLQVHVHPLRSTSWKLVLDPPAEQGDAVGGEESGDGEEGQEQP